MDKPPEDKAMPGSADSSFAAPSGTAAASPSDVGREKSWGDKYKHKVLSFSRNIGINYIINFAISALGTYALIKSPANKYLQKGVDGIANHAIAMGAPHELGKFLGEFLVRTQLLLCGGHILLPPLKSIHDHRNHLGFEIGHKLDVLQESLKRGNAATRRNLSEYKYIKDILKARPRELSDDDKVLLAKHCIGDNFQFDEKPESWKHVLTARSLGIASTTGLSGIFAMGSYFGAERKLNKPWIDVKGTYLKKIGRKYGKKWLEQPLKHIGIKDSELLGELVVLELIYTFCAKFGFDRMERRLIRKQEQEDEAAAAAALERDKKFLKQVGIRKEDAADIEHERATPSLSPSALEARRKIIEEGGKSFLARETARPAEPGMALS